jgi:hypothetical protein
MRKKDELAEIASRVYWREAEARHVVEAWQRSGESLTRFAARLGLDRRRVSRWAARLAPPGDAVHFVPVRVAAPPPEARGAAIHLELGPGRRLRLAPGFAADDLRRVLAILDERRPC